MKARQLLDTKGSPKGSNGRQDMAASVGKSMDSGQAACLRGLW